MLSCSLSALPSPAVVDCERWGVEEEVAMDVDISEEEQLLLISAVQSARGTITLATPTHSFGIPQESPIDYSVSGHYLLLLSS